MSVNDLKCTECDEVTTDVCPSCGTAALCDSCRLAVKTCAECAPEEDEDEDEDEDDEFDDTDLDDEWDEDDESDDPKSWPAPERDDE